MKSSCFLLYSCAAPSPKVPSWPRASRSALRGVPRTRPVEVPGRPSSPFWQMSWPPVRRCRRWTFWRDSDATETNLTVTTLYMHRSDRTVAWGEVTSGTQASGLSAQKKTTQPSNAAKLQKIPAERKEFNILPATFLWDVPQSLRTMLGLFFCHCSVANQYVLNYKINFYCSIWSIWLCDLADLETIY